MSLIDVRLVGGDFDGQLHRVAVDSMGMPPAAYGATPERWITDEMAAIPESEEGRAVLPVVRSDYFATGGSDPGYRPVYVHKTLSAWWWPPNGEEKPEEPWADVWEWVRYVGGPLDGTLDRLPTRFIRWHTYRKARVRDQHGVMIYLCQDLRMWTA